MTKRILSLLLCVLMLLPLLASCSKKAAKDDPGAYITMYLTEDIYDFDPANAYLNKDALNVVGLMFDTLFKLDDDGKVKKSLVKSYVINEDVENNEYSMELTLKETYWSNGIQLSAEDVVYAWKRLLKSGNSYPAASLLYDIKNARVIKEGGSDTVSIDDVGIEAVEQLVVRVTFEGPIDYDQFMLNLTSVATAPLLENYVEKNADWAKKPSTMVASGPFKLGKVRYTAETGADGYELYASDDNAINKAGEVKTKKDNIIKRVTYFILERNNYYDRDLKRDPVTAGVTPYRILVDCSKTDAQILADFKNGDIFYVGNIPLSVRGDEFVKKNAKISNALSTFVLYLNQNALISDGGEGTAIFANANVRKALSQAIDRDAIAKAVVYAEAATALVSPGVFNEGAGSKDFRKIGGDLISVAADLSSAKALLAAEGINPASYSFSIKVAAYDDVNVAIADMIAAAWGASGLGFNVTVSKVEAIQNNDYYKEVDDTPSDVCDDLFVECFQRGTYEVIAFDYNMFSADAYSALSNFAASFTGNKTMNQETGEELSSIHATGFNNQEYNELMEAIYYIPYYASLEENATNAFNLYETPDQYAAAIASVKAVYDKYGITPTTKSSKWTSQKATLLHEAEKILMNELPVIPVLFNKNAVLVSKEISKVSSTYYLPSTFQKTKLKNYTRFFYRDKNDKLATIYDDFPVVGTIPASAK